jgi:hypothetical protein
VVKILTSRPVAGGGQGSGAVCGLDPGQFTAQASQALEEKMTTRDSLGVDGHERRLLGDHHA